MIKKNYEYAHQNRCIYCGASESKNPKDGERWWFAIDEDSDKVCPDCWIRLQRSELARQGGLALSRKLGKEHYQKLAKNMNAKRWKKPKK